MARKVAGFVKGDWAASNSQRATLTLHRARLYSLIVLVLLLGSLPTRAQSVFNPTAGSGFWNVAGNWTASGIPSGVGVNTVFNSPTGIQTVGLKAAITVGSINLTNNGAFSFTLANGTGAGSLTLDQTGTANAVITVDGTGNVINVLSASLTLNDTVDFAINDTATTNALGALTMSGAMGGVGGLIKSGLGTMSFTTNAKAYTGATQIIAGILSAAQTGQMTGTSSVTVNAGAQLDLATAGTTYSFGAAGAALITLSGTGTSGSTGALRFDGVTDTNLANNVSLAAASTIHVQNTGNLFLNGTVSGNQTLTKTGAGSLVLTANNTGFTGATQVTAGTLNAAADGALAATAGIVVDGGGTLILGDINGGATDRVNNAAPIALAGGTILRADAGNEGLNQTVGLGALTLTANSSLDFGGSAAENGTLTFQSYLPGGSILSILGYDGTLNSLVAGVDGTDDRLIFNANQSGSLGQFSFTDPNGLTGSFGATQIDLGGGFFEVVPVSAVPEPATWAVAMLTACALVYTQRQRLISLRRPAA